MVIQKSQCDIAARRLGAAPDGFGKRRGVSVPARASDKNEQFFRHIDRSFRVKHGSAAASVDERGWRDTFDRSTTYYFVRY
jgi:hypothetical protein